MTQGAWLLPVVTRQGVLPPGSSGGAEFLNGYGVTIA
jgi:hypothetical protein